MFQSNSEPFGLILGAGVMFVVGALDDLIDVSPPAKLAGQVLAASLLALFGVTMFFFRMPFNLFHTDTVVLGLRPRAARHRAVGRADDERDQPHRRPRRPRGGHRRDRAAARCSCSPTACSRHGFLDGTNIGPLVAIIAVGVCLGFLPFNLHPSKIIMGDAGALFLGLLLAVPTITIGGRTDHAFSGNTFFFFGPLLIPVVILGVPILDTVFSFVRRLGRRQRWHQADAGHLHHRLMRLGHGPRRTVVFSGCGPRCSRASRSLPDVHERRQRARCRSWSRRWPAPAARWFHPGIRTRREPPSGRATGIASGAADLEPTSVVDLDEAPPQTGVTRATC